MYVSKLQRCIFLEKNYFCTNPKNGHAQESRDAFCPGNNIAALTPKNMFFSSAQLNKQLNKFAPYHIIHCFAFFSMI